MIKGLIARIKYHCLITALRGPQTTWTISTILSDDLGHYYGVLIKVFEYFVVLGLHWILHDRSDDSGLTVAG
jgi:hypothetical protein